MEDIETLERLGVALALGLLIGTERGWSERGEEEGKRIAGIRSFGLIGLLGALWSLVSMTMGTVVLATGFAGFAILVTVAHWLKARKMRDFGITTEVAALITFTLGAVAVQGYLSIAACTAVVTTILLGLKPTLHEWLRRLEPNELHAILKLLLISLVLLPILPDRGYGPWQTLNPYEIWWMVVLITAISSLGYFAIKIAGPRQGAMLTALSGGLVSSTAVAVSFARMARREPTTQRILAAGVVAASTTMFPRTLLVSSVIEPSLFEILVWPLVMMTVLGYGVAFWQWKMNSGEISTGSLPLQNPFEIRTALQFGGLLALVMFFSKALQVWMGNRGVYLLAGVAGFSDVDAVTLSLSRLVPQQLDSIVAATAIMIAVMANTIVKAAIVMMIGRGKMGIYVGTGFTAILISGFVGLLLSGGSRIALT